MKSLVILVLFFVVVHPSFMGGERLTNSPVVVSVDDRGSGRINPIRETRVTIQVVPLLPG